MVLAAEIGLHARTGVECQRILLLQVWPGQLALCRLRVYRKRIVAVVSKSARCDLELSGWRVEAGRPVTAQHALLPLLVLLNHRVDLDCSTRRAHIVEGESRSLQHVFQELLLRLWIEVAVAKTFSQLRHYEEVAARLADRLDDLFANAKYRAIRHVRGGLVVCRRGQHDIGIGGISRELSVDRHQKIKPFKGLFPDLRLRPGGDNRRADDQQHANRVRLVF